MRDARTVLKRCMEQACSPMRIRFGRFAADVGLNDFLLDTFDVPRAPKEIAARALNELCERDNRPNDNVVCMAVVAFLDEMLGGPKEDRFRRLKDLADLVGSSTTSAELERWIESWYEVE